MRVRARDHSSRVRSGSGPDTIGQSPIADLGLLGLQLLEGRRERHAPSCRPSQSRVTVAEPTLAFEHSAEAQQRGLIQPFPDKLDADRQLLGAEGIGH
jgi:hypothetical protein